MINKKLLVMGALVLSLGITACSEKKAETKEPVKQEETTDKQEKPVETENEKQDEEEKESEKSKVSVEIYKMSQEEEKIITETVEYDELNEKNIWTSLKEAQVVGKDTEVLSLMKNGDKLELDVNTEFGNQLRSSGTTGEEELLHCVVNTYLDAYECEEIKITEEKEVLISGHAEYDNYMKRFE